MEVIVVSSVWYEPQLLQMAPDTADSTFVCSRQCQTANSRNLDVSDTIQAHSPTCQPKIVGRLASSVESCYM